MNNNYNIPYIPIDILNQQIYEELKKLNYNLINIQNLLEKKNNNPENNYLKKEDNYHII